jgi:hypothetical protein
VADVLLRVYDDVASIVRRRWRDSLRIGSPVAIRTYSGSALRVDKDAQIRGEGLLADRDATFVLVDPRDPYSARFGHRVRYGQPVGLRSLATGAFWGVNYDDQSVLNCNAGAVREWETFEFQEVRRRRPKIGGFIGYGDHVAIRSFARWHGEKWWYLQFRLETSHLCRANVQHVKGWETYVVARPQNEG